MFQIGFIGWIGTFYFTIKFLTCDPPLFYGEGYKSFD